MTRSTDSVTGATPDLTPGPARDRATSIAAFVVRIVAGLLWLENLSWKTPPRFGADDNSGLYFFTQLAVEHPVLPPYSALVENVVLPNFGFFGWAVFLLEIGLAVFLLLGLATRLWAVLGIVQTVAIFLSVAAAPHEWVWSYYLMAAAHVAVLGFAAGRVWGLDGLLRPKARKWGNARLTRAYLMSS